MRQSNFELLRIILMIFIILHHFSVHGKFNFYGKELSVNKLFLHFIAIGGRISVNTYILISGYFLVNSKGVKINKVIKLELQMMTYSLLGYAIGIAAKVEPFEYRELIRHIFPVTSSIWWFATYYVLLYLLFPVINSAIHALNKIVLRNYLIFLTVIWSVIPTLLLFEVMLYGANRLLWFAYIYTIGAYIKKYSIGKNTKAKTWIMIAIAIYLFIFVFVICCDIIGLSSEQLFKCAFESTKIPILLASIALFIGFSNINISSSIINNVSATTFGIYLIHDNYYISKLLWRGNYRYQNSHVLIPFCIYFVLEVFIVCSLIESIRASMLESFYMKYVDALSLKIEKFITKMNNSEYIKKL